MQFEWSKPTFAELMERGVLEIGDGYRAKNDELGGQGLIFLRAGHVTDTHIDFANVECFKVLGAEKFGPKVACPGDVVVTTKGNSTGRVAFVTDAMPSFVYSPHLSYWRSKMETVLHQGFLRAWSRGEEFAVQLAAMSRSTDMAPYLSLTDQRRLHITLPPIAVQRQIGELSDAINKRLDNLRETNTTLEAIAQALFKSWFVDFEPVRAKMEGRIPVGMDETTAALFPDRFEDGPLEAVPRGWRPANIGEIASVIDCLHSKKPSFLKEGRPYLQLNNIRDDGLLELSKLASISQEDYTRWISRIEVACGDCVITNVGRVGAVSQIPEGFKAAMGRNMTAVRLKPDWPYPTYLIELLLSGEMKSEIENKTDTGTILNALNVRSIPLLRCLLAPHDVMEKFELITRPLRAGMETNLGRIQTLINLRDTLLPRLISGQLRIPEAQAQLDALAA